MTRYHQSLSGYVDRVAEDRSDQIVARIWTCIGDCTDDVHMVGYDK